jgi:DUF3102 family protein
MASDKLDGTIASVAREIRRLHSEILTTARTTLAKAIRIGELLTRVRASRRGKWMEWLQSNAPFSHQTAYNYIRVYEHRDDPKFQNVLNLADAYAALCPPKSKAARPQAGNIETHDLPGDQPLAQSVNEGSDNTETSMPSTQRTKSVRRIMREISLQAIDRDIKKSQIQIDQRLAFTALEITRHNRVLWPDFPERLIQHGKALICEGERLDKMPSKSTADLTTSDGSSIQ